ncbi:MAG: hypothetical protein QOH21_1538 [Acidobacteriota bacterium]|nr:hypothetical protein [Acidobacteriota bacterium]
MKTRILFLLAFLCISWLPMAGEPPDHTLVPRRPGNKQAARVPRETVIERVVLKFHEGTHVRLRGRSLAAHGRDARENAKLASLGLTPAQVENDLHAVHALLASNRLVRGIDRLFTIPEDDLAAWRASGEERSGRELADLDLYYDVEVPDGTTQADIDLLVDALNAIASIEIAYATPPSELAGDIPPTTPNFQSQQGYLNAAPNGINALYAWTIPGGRGTGTKIVDIERAWQTTHEDLPPMFHTGGTQEPGDNSHGTAVMGVLVAGNNGYGVTGIVHEAQIGYEVASSNTEIADPVTRASMAVGVSGLVLIEKHWKGPDTPATPCGCSTTSTANQCDFVPMEYWQGNFDAIAAATANGRIVVEAGGNGSTNLDDPIYGGKFNRMVRDSGAILVGASASYPRSPACFTNYGSRIDMHGWGEGVVTLGYGDHPAFHPADQNQWYTNGFGGTSSASPIVTGAAASIIVVSLADGQGYGGRTPAEIRKILRDTGTPQASDPRNIGPMPNLALAIPRILDRKPVASFTINCISLTCTADASASSDDHGIVSYQWDWGDGSTATGPTANHSYDAEDYYTVGLAVTDIQGQSGSTSHDVNIVITPPTGPNGFEATGTSSTTVALSWTAAAGGVGSIAYGLQRRTTYNGAWGPEIVTSSTSYVDTQVSYGVLYEYRIRAVDSTGLSSEYVNDSALTVIFGPDLPPGTIIDGDHIRDLRDGVDAWRTYAGLAQVYPPNPVPVGEIKAAHFITNYASDPLPGVVSAIDEAFSAIGWPGVIYGGVPAPAPGVTVSVEHVNQLRGVMTWW